MSKIILNACFVFAAATAFILHAEAGAYALYEEMYPGS